MGNFVEMLQHYQTINEDIDDSDNLITFFSVMKAFNKDKQINIEVKKQYEKYFRYRWAHKKLHDNGNIFEQLPDFVQDDLFTSFIFK